MGNEKFKKTMLFAILICSSFVEGKDSLVKSSDKTLVKPKRHIQDWNQGWTNINNNHNNQPFSVDLLPPYPSSSSASHSNVLLPLNPPNPAGSTLNTQAIFHPKPTALNPPPTGLGYLPLPPHTTPVINPVYHGQIPPHNILGINKHTHTHSEHTITKEVAVPVTNVVHVPKPYPVEKVVYVNRPISTPNPTTTSTISNGNHGWNLFKPIHVPGGSGTLSGNSWNSWNAWNTGYNKPSFSNLPTPFQAYGVPPINADYGLNDRINQGYIPSVQGGLNGVQGYNTYAPTWKW